MAGATGKECCSRYARQKDEMKPEGDQTQQAPLIYFPPPNSLPQACSRAINPKHTRHRPHIERFRIFPRSAQAHAAATSELSQWEGIPPAPLQHLRSYIPCNSDTTACSEHFRARAATPEQASTLRANHARLTPASLPQHHKSLQHVRQGRRCVTPTF